MTNSNPRWRDNFYKPIILKCKNEYCNNIVHTISAAKHQGVYCPECRKEARLIYVRNYEARHPGRKRKT